MLVKCDLFLSVYMCIYTYIFFFQGKEREREIERIFDDRDSEEFVLQHGQTFGKLKL